MKNLSISNLSDPTSVMVKEPCAKIIFFLLKNIWVGICEILKKQANEICSNIARFLSKIVDYYSEISSLRFILVEYLINNLIRIKQKHFKWIQKWIFFDFSLLFVIILNLYETGAQNIILQMGVLLCILQIIYDSALS